MQVQNVPHRDLIDGGSPVLGSIVTEPDLIDEASRAAFRGISVYGDSSEPAQYTAPQIHRRCKRGYGRVVAASLRHKH
jgi:hypothetical protein